jgi:putative phosphoesterase
MKLAILSDTHGDVRRVQEALNLLEAKGAEAFVICGDLCDDDGGPEVLEAFAGRRCWFVWGNTDHPHPSWRPYVEALGLPWPNGPLELTLGGKRIGVFHGNEPTFAQPYKEARLDYLFFGHTHRRNDSRQGTMRVINPGALHRARVKSVALLDLATDDLEFIELPD